MAPVSRSSPASAISTSNSKCNTVARKKFACTFSGCGKYFSRSEHLHRHALNHKDGDNTCLRCMAHFRRRDLLDRHMARHKEKDDEAGGEGLGVLATRKRLWMDANGNIVNARRPTCTLGSFKQKCPRLPEKKRPSLKSTLVNGRPLTQMTQNTESHTLELHNEQKPFDLSPESWLDMTTHDSSPISEVGADSVVPNAREILPENLESLYEDPWPIVPNGLPDIFSNSSIMARQHEYATTNNISSTSSSATNTTTTTTTNSSLWGGQQVPIFMASLGDISSDDVFKNDSNIYGWQTWNSQVVTSRCREEKVDLIDESKRDCFSRFDRVCA